MLLRTPEGSVVKGEPGANVTLAMLFSLSLSPKVVTDVGIVNDVIVPVWVQLSVATEVTGIPPTVAGIVTDAPLHVASQPVIVAEVPLALVHVQPLDVPPEANTPVPTVAPLGTVGVELKLLYANA